MHKNPPPSKTSWKLRQIHETRTVVCSGRHSEGMLRCSLLFLTHRKHTGNFYRSTVVCKQAHSFSVCLTRFLKQHTHTQAHMMIKRSEGLQGTLGLGTAVNHSYDVVHAFYSDLSERFGSCAHWWVSQTRQGHGGLPSLSFLLLRHLGSALSLPRAKQWQVRCPESSLLTAGLRDTAGVNEVKTEPNSGANRPQSLVLLHHDTWATEPTSIQQHLRHVLTLVDNTFLKKCQII